MASRSYIENFFTYAKDYLNHPRTVHKYKQPVRMGFTMGMFAPIGAPIRVLPGDTFSLDLTALVRTSSALIVPPLDDMYLDVACFWVPDRIIWTHYKQWLGENDTTAWTQNNEYPFPAVLSSDLVDVAYYDDGEGLSFDFDGTFLSNYSLWTSFGLPYKINVTDDYNINALPFRVYYAAWNEFIRNPNYQRPVLFSVGDDGGQGEYGYTLIAYGFSHSGSSYTISAGDGFDFEMDGDSIIHLNCGILMPVNKFRMSITSMLPQPQAGDPATINIGGLAPVGIYNDLAGTASPNLSTNVSVLYPESIATNTFKKISQIYGYLDGSDPVTKKLDLSADLSKATAITINQLRESILMQEFKELLARGGQRAQNILYSMFGVENSALMHDKPELLCQKRVRVGVNQIVATADSDNSAGAVSHLGETGAYSITGIQESLFTKSFTEHGHILTCIFARHNVSWSQGIPEQFLVVNKYDEYWPCFDHVGEQGIKAITITAESDPDLVVGYQEAWYWYRTQRAVNTGIMDPAISGSLNYYTLGSVFNKITALNGIGPGFFVQTPDEVDRVLLVPHTSLPTFIGDFVIHGKAARVMSEHSDPLVFGQL